MIKISMNFDEKTVERIVERMPARFKLRLMRKLEKQTREKRWKTLFKRVDKRLKDNPITEKEVADEIAAFRKEKHAKGCS